MSSSAVEFFGTITLLSYESSYAPVTKASKKKSSTKPSQSYFLSVVLPPILNFKPVLKTKFVALILSVANTSVQRVCSDAF